VRAATAAVGAAAVDADCLPIMASEDFGVLARAIPGCFAFIGNGCESGHGGTALHSRDYDFNDQNGRTVKLADLFGRHDTLVTYFWMYGPQRERPCPMCTSFLGSIDIPSKDLSQRIAIAAIGRSPVERQLAFARERGWKHLKFYATVGDDFARDYRGLAPDGSEWPALDVWVQRDGKVFHFWGAELGGTSDPGQDPRGAPDPTPLWNLLDLTPGGRGVDWYPKLDYPSAG
jgi:predicted dithiol-disulfide oxidoreductase (DUF899 family)